jgi:hypothetical protein
MPRFNAQAAVAALESKFDQQGQALSSLVSMMERLTGQPATNANGSAARTPPANLPEILPINAAVVATERPTKGNFLTQPELAARAAMHTGIHDEGDSDFVAEPVPADNPNVKGPVWSSKVLRNKYGTFPAHHRRQNPQTKKLETTRYDVSPADRSNFMAQTQGRQFGIEATIAVPDGNGGEKIVRFPAVCNLTQKQFSSYDHGLYGKVESLVLTLPDGSEYVLDGQVNLQLSKRLQ